MKLSHVNKICHAMIGGSKISLEGSVDEEVCIVVASIM